MELRIKASDYIYYPPHGDYGGSEPPEDESVEITGIALYDAETDTEFPALDTKLYNFLYSHYEAELIEDALEQEKERE
jgi:hypothetical protein